MADSARVFISYSTKDADLVERLKTALAQTGVAVWLDHEQLAPGTPDWRAAVVRGIEQATDVVYAASLDAAESIYVGHELAIASDEGKRILPFWVRGEKWSRCAPMGYYHAQYIDGRDAAYAVGVTKLLDVLGVVSAAKSLPPHHPDSRWKYERGHIREEIGRGELIEANVRCERYLSRFPDDVEVIELRLAVLRALGRDIEADAFRRREVRRGIQLSESPPSTK